MHRSHRHSTIEALLTSRLLLLDKNPGLRPTGVRKLSKKNRWESNSISFEKWRHWVHWLLTSMYGSRRWNRSSSSFTQCTWMKTLMLSVVLVDASNAFNSLNPEVFLHNISYVYSTISVLLKTIHHYRKWIEIDWSYHARWSCLHGNLWYWIHTVD